MAVVPIQQAQPTARAQRAACPAVAAVAVIRSMERKLLVLAVVVKLPSPTRRLFARHRFGLARGSFTPASHLQRLAGFTKAAALTTFRQRRSLLMFLMPQRLPILPGYWLRWPYWIALQA